MLARESGAPDASAHRRTVQQSCRIFIDGFKHRLPPRSWKFDNWGCKLHIDLPATCSLAGNVWKKKSWNCESYRNRCSTPGKTHSLLNITRHRLTHLRLTRRQQSAGLLFVVSLFESDLFCSYFVLLYQRQIWFFVSAPSVDLEGEACLDSLCIHTRQRIKAMQWQWTLRGHNYSNADPYQSNVWLSSFSWSMYWT